MLACVYSGTTVGLDSVLVTVEVDISAHSLPSFTIVGLPDKAVEESRERVRSAIKNSGADFPPKRITVNLAPANLPKQGPAYDLPIAIAMLLASEQLQAKLNDALLLGELSLDGSVRHTRGVLPFVLLAKEKKFRRVFLPRANALEASVIRGIDIYPLSSLSELFQHLSGGVVIKRHPHTRLSDLDRFRVYESDFATIKGQEQAKRVAEIGAAGGHNMHLKGPPGAGKTLLARSMPSILPELTEREALEVTKIYSITGNLTSGDSLIQVRPFRSPHHTTSRIGLIGGGTSPIPGEISLAHRGVLFLDEFPEFPRNVLESLRQPLEDGRVTISRASGAITYPAKFMLVAASNPCPCGFFGDETRRCRCLPGQLQNYRKRVSGPLMDRIDLHVVLPAVKTAQLINAEKSESSASIRQRVQRARNLQSRRYKKTPFICNADLDSKAIKEFITLTSEARTFLQRALQALRLSARSFDRTLKVAQTMVDLDGETEIQTRYLAEALQYRFGEEMNV